MGIDDFLFLSIDRHDNSKKMGFLRSHSNPLFYWADLIPLYELDSPHSNSVCQKDLVFNRLHYLKKSYQIWEIKNWSNNSESSLFFLIQKTIFFSSFKVGEFFRVEKGKFVWRSLKRVRSLVYISSFLWTTLCTNRKTLIIFMGRLSLNRLPNFFFSLFFAKLAFALPVYTDTEYMLHFREDLSIMTNFSIFFFSNWNKKSIDFDSKLRSWKTSTSRGYLTSTLTFLKWGRNY